MVVVCLMLAVGLAGCTLNRPPLAVVSAPVISGPAPLDVEFDLSHCEDPDGDGMVFTLDFGDQSEPVTSDSFNIIVHHTYHTGDEFIVSLRVTDTEGNEGEDRLTITVSDDGPPVGLAVGETAPEFSAHTTNDDEIALSDYAGAVVLIDFWGAWCRPCRVRMPHLQDLHDRFSPDGLVVILVSTDQEKQDTVDFLNANDYTDLVCVWEPGYKSQNPIAQLYDVHSFPHTFLLDRQGVIRYVGHPDHLTTETIEQLL